MTFDKVVCPIFLFLVLVNTFVYLKEPLVGKLIPAILCWIMFILYLLIPEKLEL